MKLNRYIVGSVVFVLVTGVLYLVGHIFKIEILTFHQKHIVSPGVIIVEARSLLPFIIGIGASYIAEKIYLTKKYDL